VSPIRWKTFTWMFRDRCGEPLRDGEGGLLALASCTVAPRAGITIGLDLSHLLARSSGAVALPLLLFERDALQSALNTKGWLKCSLYTHGRRQCAHLLVLARLADALLAVALSVLRVLAVAMGDAVHAGLWSSSSCFLIFCARACHSACV